VEFISMALFNFGGSLGEFGLEASPDSLLIVVLLLEEEAEGFFRTKLGNAGEILNAEAIQNLGSLQLAFAQTQRALNGFGRHRQLRGHAILPVLLTEESSQGSLCDSVSGEESHPRRDWHA
jgi:hypothetical protein